MTTDTNLPPDLRETRTPPPRNRRRWWNVGLVVTLVLLLALAALLRDAPAPDEPSIGLPTEEPEQPEGAEQPEEAEEPDRAGEEEEPEVAQGEQLSGLHYTPAELEIWRERAQRGPYRQAGDVSPGSPGDWERISDNAEEFLDSDLDDLRWSPDWGSGAMPETERTGDRDLIPDADYLFQVRDAAFYALVMDDEELGREVIEELVAQAREPRADLGDRDRFPATGPESEVTASNPFFMTASSLGILLSAKDYVKHWATEDELEELDEWHREGAEWLAPKIIELFDSKFVDRQDGDYSVPDDFSIDVGRIPFYDGPPTTTYGRSYNNRAATIFLYLAMVGIDQDIDYLKEQSKLWFEEYIKFSVYPPEGEFEDVEWSGGGFVAEFERWEKPKNSSAGADLGWAYGTNALAIVGGIADHFARAGDPSLYEYETREGMLGTEADEDQEPKSLLYAMRELAKHTNGTIERYGTDDEDRLNEDFLIDGVNERWEWESDVDVAYAIMNLYYDDPLIRQAYLREGRGFRPYVTSDFRASNGRNLTWQGEWGAYPGVLFQAGQLEGEVDPYPSRG